MIMSKVLVAAVAALTLGSAVQAQTPTAAPGAPPDSTAKPFEILRPGDRELSCDQLAAEYNSLISGQAEAQQRAQAETARVAAEQQKKSRRTGLMRGLARGALGVASVGGLGGGFDTMMAASQASSALDAADGMSNLRQLIGAVRGEPTPGVQATPEAQRLERVSSLFKEQSC